MVNIDECLKEICDSGGCHNKLVVDEQSPVMVNTKGKSFVGVGTRIVPECQCFAKNFTKPLTCLPDYCFNGGTCSKDDWGDLRYLFTDKLLTLTGRFSVNLQTTC